MDAETKQYLDEKLAELLATMNAWFTRLEGRPAQPQSGASLGELEDRVLSLEDRFRTMQLSMDMFERRTDDRLHTIDARSRL